MVSDPTFDAFYPAALAATTVEPSKVNFTTGKPISVTTAMGGIFAEPSSFNVYQPWLKGYAGQSFADDRRIFRSDDVRRIMVPDSGSNQSLK